MILFLLVIAVVVWLVRSYCGWIVSSILSLLARTPISVGDVRWMRITDLRFRLLKDVSIHIDFCQVQFFPQHVSKPILLRFGDVRIEASSGLLPKPGTGSTSTANSTWARLINIGQYCGVSVTSVQLVLLDTIPDCMLHVSGDELSAEAFRSREGWQLELSCRLAQGKLLRRRDAPERLLANSAVSLQLSIDVSSDGLNRFGLRLADPSINLYRGILDVIQEIRESKEKMEEEEEKEKVSVLTKLQKMSDATVSISNCMVIYTGISKEQRRSVSLRISEVELQKKRGVTTSKVVGLTIADHMHNTVISTGLLSAEITESSAVAAEVKLCSDHVLTSVLLQDLLWWKVHFTEVASCLQSTGVKSTAKKSEMTVTWLAELDSVQCNISDGEGFQSAVSVQLLTFSKNESDWELGAESLVVADPERNPAGASYEYHQWGHTVYVGVAIVQYIADPTEPSVFICVDDFKAEWSDKLASQINRLVQSLNDLQSSSRRPTEKKVAVKLKSKRASLVCIAKNATFLLCTAEELAFERGNGTDFVCSARSTRIGISAVTPEGIHISDLLNARRIMPSVEEDEDGQFRCWSQAEKDKRRLEKRRAFEEQRNKGIKLIGEASLFCVSLESTASAVTRDMTISSNAPIYVCWSPLIHRVLYHLTKGVKEAFSSAKKAESKRVPPKILQLKVLTNHSVELDMDLPRFHRMVWKIPSLTLDKSANGLSALSPQLTITMNGYDIITAVGVCITKRPSDQKMDACRKALDGLQLHNKVWTWAADSFLFRLPFQFNFHQVFDEFINCIKWIKIVHAMQKKPFTADSPLPSDIRIVFKEAKLEMEDDPFENLLQSNHELKEDEVYECERRRQMLAERLHSLKKTSPLFPQSKVDELLASLQEKNSSIYIERWEKLGFSARPLFVSTWQGFEIRAFADPSLHGTDICTQMIHEFDPSSYFPTCGLTFSTLWGRSVEFDMTEWKIQFKDYPYLYLDAEDVHFFGTLVGAEEFEEGGRSLRESVIDLPAPWETHTVLRNMSPLKFYYDMQCEAAAWNVTYGPCWEPCLAMISMLWNNISAPSRDPSPPLPFWDKMRFLLHGRFSWLCGKMVTTMLASPDPYNSTETVEFSWDNLGLDWALGEIRIRCGLRVFIRTASRYDDSRIISLPDLKLRINLDWICGGDPHDHHAVTLCAPHRLPHYSTDHDSYRAFRSRCLDLALSFDVGAGAGSGDSMPQCLFYANNFRCFEFLMKTLTMKNRPIRRGPIFGTPFYNKPQISKHFRKVQISMNLPKFFITYWMSHTSDFGFRITSDGLNLLATLKLTAVASTDKEITRRAVHVWSPEHVSATLWGSQVHVFGSEGRRMEQQDGEEVPDEQSLLLGISRVSYVRENNAGWDTAIHRLTAHDLRASWTAEIRDACLAIADGIHRAHLLRRILSNDAIKILNLHQEDEHKATNYDTQTSRQDSFFTEGGHRRGLSMSDTNQTMLDQLVEESSTRLIAHCEQATDLPIDSLQGVLQCTMDDVHAINWQIDLLNSQLVLKGSERGGFVLLTAARASLAQKIHKSVWRSGQLLGKKSWSAVITGMQYFAPVGMPSAGSEAITFRFLPREVIEEKATDSSDDYLSHFVADGEAVGGVVQPGDSANLERYQLQRIVSRCSCEIYFCYFSEKMKADALEETGVPKVEAEPVFGREEGVDCLTVKHNMLEASTSSEQYEMLVDIANTLVLFIDPKKKELAENRRRIRFSCEMTEMEQMRQSIVEQQSDLRDIVAVVRSLERQLFHLDSQNDLDEAALEAKRQELSQEMEEYKTKQLDVSDQLAIYISCYKQRQVEATLAVVRKPEEDLAAVARRFEVCFEDCIWRLTESDGQIALSEIQIRNFLYTRTMRIDNSGEHHFEVGSVRISNLLPDSIYKDTLHRDDRLISRQPAIRLLLRDIAPVGGICVKEHFEVNIAPMVAQLTYEFFEKMMGFFFPGKNIHKEDQLENVDEAAPKFSFTRRITGSLSMRSNKSVQMERKASTLNGKPKAEEIDDIERMRQRAHDNNFFLYIKIPEVPFVVSYKGINDKNIEDIDRFGFVFPLCEFHEKNWTWLDLSLAVKQRCKRVLLQQFMKQKLLRNRLLPGGPEPIEGMTEDDKKRIALGSTTGTIERKKKK